MYFNKCLCRKIVFDDDDDDVHDGDGDDDDDLILSSIKWEIQTRYYFCISFFVNTSLFRKITFTIYGEKLRIKFQFCK